MEAASGVHGATETFPSLFLQTVERLGDRSVAIREKDFGIWQSHTWADAWQHIRDFANGLAALGFRRGDRICIVGDNRPQLYWGMLAAQCLGGVPVPLYQDSIEREMQYIVEHSEARFALVEDQEQVDKFLGIKPECPRLEYVIYKDGRGLRNYHYDYLQSYEAVQERGRAFAAEHPQHLTQEIARNRSGDAAMICYTSGTTGRPKGVVLTHHNFIYSTHGLVDYEQLSPHEEILAYLPIAWAGDMFLSFGLAIAAGHTVNCPESGVTVMQDLREAGPTIFFAPPRIWENLLTTVMIRMDDAGWLKRRMFHYFIGLAQRVQARRNEGRSVGPGQRVLYALGELLVYGPLRDNLGFTRVKLAYTAGEAMGPEIWNFFRSLGINLKQIYAMTEAGIFISIPKGNDVRPDTNGPPVPWVDVRISDSGEVLIKGDGLFTGYLKNEEATREAFDGDYFRTGDAGMIDHLGHLRIIDRAKDVSRLEDGTLFAPKYLENKLKFSPYIKEAVALGQERPYVTCLINIDAEAVGNWAERRNIAYSSYTELSQRPEVLDLIDTEVRRVNASLAEEEQLRGAQIHRWLILHKELDPDDDEITRTRKVRRRVIAEKYKALIDGLYSDADHVATEARVTFEDGRQATIRADLRIRTVPPVTRAA
jgi:long-chain acyl-CoA synthetase